MLKHNFILLADAPLLDFVNTLIKHSNHETEYLLNTKQAELFFKLVFKKNVPISKNSLQTIKIYRQKLFLLFTKLIRSQSSKKPIKSVLPSIDGSALCYCIEFSKASDQGRFHLSLIPISNDRPLQIIIQNLFDFILEADPSRIKKCKSETCSHLFYDKTKANKRAWCSMKSCGNLAKVRKFRNKK